MDLTIKFKCFCGKRAKNICSTCNITRYCSIECQEKDWKSHKKLCGKCDQACHVQCPKYKLLSQRKFQNEKLFEMDSYIKNKVREILSHSDFKSWCKETENCRLMEYIADVSEDKKFDYGEIKNLTWLVVYVKELDSSYLLYSDHAKGIYKRLTSKNKLVLDDDNLLYGKGGGKCDIPSNMKIRYRLLDWNKGTCLGKNIEL